MKEQVKVMGENKELKKVYLSPILKNDMNILFKWINDKKLVVFNSAYKPIDELSHVEWFESIRNDSSIVIFGIRKIVDDELIGSCQLHSINLVHRHAELQIRIGNIKEQSKGFGTDAIFLLVKFGFEDLNLNKIFLEVFSDNHKAICVYKKNGFIIEGKLQNHYFINGIYKDVSLMSIMRGGGNG